MILIDVRTPDEYSSGHYPNAINHDLDLIMQGIFPDVPKDTEIRLYCYSGSRAEMAMKLMQHAGFIHVTNIGGYDQ